MEEYRYRNDRLFCENVDLGDLAERWGTPLYVYSSRSIVDHCRHIEKSFGTMPHLSCYAVKANANREILRILSHEGIGADIGSIGELQLALGAGFPSSKITFSGVGKRDDEIAAALKEGILGINVESEEEIRIIGSIAASLGTRAKISLRVNFDIRPRTHPYVTTGARHNKFGVAADRAVEVLRSAGANPSLEVVGIHSHIGSQITEQETFQSAGRALVRLVDDLRASGIPVSQVNFGGGFGVQYHDFLKHPQLPHDAENPEGELTTVKLLQAVLPILGESGAMILIQPGRSIVAHAGILLTKVLYRKLEQGRVFIIVDAGMNDLIRPSLYQSYHQIVPLRLRNAPAEAVDVVGPLCESGDYFALDRMMPAVDRGDVLAVLCTGAYGYVLSSNYNGRPRPAEVLVDGDRSSLITPRESLQRLYAG